MECAIGLCAYGRQFVSGVGPLPAPILIIGENPGARELESGVPFVGPAGKVLDRCLEAAGISRSQCRITNTACCTDLTRAVRKPTPGEIESCWPRLMTEIVLCQPKIIICMGNTPANEFFPGIKITAARGKLRAWPMGERVIPVIATYHPSFSLRNPKNGARELIIEDLILAKGYL